MGIILGALIVVWEALVFRSGDSYLWHPFLKVAAVIATAAAGWALATAYRGFAVSAKRDLLQPPIDLLKKDS